MRADGQIENSETRGT